MSVNGFDWRLTMTKTESWGDSAGLGTSAGLGVVHYDQGQQVRVSLYQQLTPEQRVILDEQGGDAMFPAQFQAFSDVLGTFSFSP